MKEPEVDRMLTSFSGTLLTKIMPQVKSDYAQKDLTLIALALNGAAEEYDRAAETRTQENRAMRSIFADAAPLIEDGELRSRIEQAAAAEPESLRIRDLNAANAELSEALIALHAYAEEQAGDPWRNMERRIWDELRARTQRRAIGFFPF